jgi:hypothetical protein
MATMPNTPPVSHPTPPKRYKKGDPFTPADYLKGSRKVGGAYTAWDTYGQGRPDFGVGAGPGTPYHEVQKKVKAPAPWGSMGHSQTPLPKWAGGMQSLPTNNTAIGGSDPRITAIRKRLGWAIP